MATRWQTRTLINTSDRDAWLLARKLYLTASDVPAVLGLDQRSRRAVLRDKLTTEVRPELRMAAVAAGRHLEQGVLDWYLADQALPVELVRPVPLIQSPDFPWLAATPDAVVDGEPAEVKVAMWQSRPNWHAVTRSTKGWPRGFELPIACQRNVEACPVPASPKEQGPAAEWRGLTRIQLNEVLPKMGPPEAPLKYWVQLQVQMHVLGSDYGTLVSLQGGTNRYDLTYEIDLGFQAWMFGELERFRAEWKTLV